MIAKVREACQAYLDPGKLLPMAQSCVEEAKATDTTEAEIQSLKGKIESMTAHLDSMYMDKLSGLLNEDDFQRSISR